MKIKVYRGSNEIGGTCIKLSSKNNTLVLDLGLPLNNLSNHIDVSEIKPDALIISHPHQDHYGLIKDLNPKIPVYIGELGKKLIDATRIFIGEQLLENNFKYYKSWEAFYVGDFKITPYLVDHSAVDSYSFLIEAEGERVFYSGDFRAHGRKSILFEKIINNPPKNIDLLFLEGTMLRRSNKDFPTEKDVEKIIYKTIKNQENISFLISSSQNIDRIVSAYRACKRSGKILIIDIYTAWVLEQLKTVSENTPRMEWDFIRVYASYSHDKRLIENHDFFGDFRKRVYNFRIKKDAIQKNPANYLFLSRTSHFKTINFFKNKKAVGVIYSQWLGYLSKTNKEYYGIEEIAAYKNDPHIHFVYAHTSGHAVISDLQNFAKALQAKRLVPIHTDFCGDYSEFFENVYEISDGCELSIDSLAKNQKNDF